MGYSRLTDRLAFDVGFLLWRAEVDMLPPEDVARRYREIERHYLSLVGQEERTGLQAELQAWQPRIAQPQGRPDAG